jgi:hypothetical protein
MTTTPDPATAAQAVFAEAPEHAAAPDEAPESKKPDKKRSRGQFADMWRRFKRPPDGHRRARP